MSLTIERAELKEMLEDAGKIAVAFYIRQQAPAKDRISQNKAYQMFGEARVKGWVSRRQIIPIREGDARNSTRYYSLAELRVLEATEKHLFTLNRKRRAI